MPIFKPQNSSLVDKAHLVGHTKIIGYIVYSDGQPHWWSRFLENGYKHCYFIQFTGLIWIKVDYTLGFLDFGVLPYDYRDTIDDIISPDDTYQRVEAWRKVRRYRSIIAPLSCVELVKAVMGVSIPWVLTPYQLFNLVERKHGRISRRRR